MAKQRFKHLVEAEPRDGLSNFKMPSISHRKSLVVSILLSYLFIVGVSGHPKPEDSSNSSSNNNNNSSLSVQSSNNSTSNCVCDASEGESVPCAKNLTASDCPNGRIIARSDCSCCFVCAKQLTETCNDKDVPCDSDYGLTCGSDKKCQAKTPCSDDTSCSNDLMCVGGACADPCKVLPSVCREMNLKNGICVARNHRSICSCPPGQSVNSENECAPIQEEVTQCERDGLTYKIGEKFYKDSCAKYCECETSGSLNCRAVEGHPECKNGTIPLSKLGGEMTRTCKLLIGHGRDFDGCCVPEQCANVTVSREDVDLQTNNNDNINGEKSEVDDAAKEGRKFKTNEGSPNNLGDSMSGEESKTETVLPKQEMEVSTTEESSSSSPSSSKSSRLSVDASSTSASTTEEDSMQVTILQRTDHSAVIDLPKSSNEAILSIALTSQLNKDPSNKDVWKEHKIPPGLPQITLSDLIPNTSYTLKYSVSGKDSSAVQFITNEIGTTSTSPSETSSQPASSSRGGGVGTATGRSMKIDDVTPTGSEVISDSTEASSVSSEAAKPAAAVDSVEEAEHKRNKHGHHHQHEDSSSMDPMMESSTEAESGSLEDSITSPSSSTPVKGCMHNGTMHEVGQTILNGCDEKCTCMEDGDVKCMERCILPFFKKGSFAHDKMCFEEPSGVDECCVIIACARGKQPEARELIPIHPEPCDSVKCGKNARCLGPSGMLGDDENQTNQTLCLCNEGFVGDPYDEVHGCQESVTPASPVEGSSTTASVPIVPDGPSSTAKPEGCIFNNQTFEFGDEHFDGCNYKCRCENSGEFTCLPRCNYRRDDENEIPKGCEIQKDPSDSCCEMLVCHGKPLESGTRKDESTSTQNGCVYKNKTYAEDEKFYDECESQCTCYSNGDVTCQPRCPPAGPHSGENNCVTLEDPVDKCCKVTICGNQTLYDEVMKAEAAKKSTSTTSTTVAPATGVQRSMTSSEEALSHGTHEHDSSLEMPHAGVSGEVHELDIKISMVVPLNSTAMMVTVNVPENELATLLGDTMIIKYSHDLSTWRDQEFHIKDLFTEGTEELHTIITGLAPGQSYYFKAVIKGFESNAASGLTKLHEASEEIGSSMEGHSMEHDHMLLGPGSEEDEEGKSMSIEGVPCKHKDKTYEPGQEFYDGCEAYCLCDGKGNVTCVEIDCPKDGRELIDESCVKWEPDLRNFRKEAPYCCPDMVCVQHNHCELDDGYILQNFEEIPQKFTGCDKTCQCLYGNITCHPGNNCPPVSEHPPKALACPPELARQVPMIENECCVQWTCLNHTADGLESVAGLVPQNNLNRQTTQTTTASKTHLHKDLQPHLHSPSYEHNDHDTRTHASSTNLTHLRDPSSVPVIPGLHHEDDHDHDNIDEDDDQVVDPHDYDQYLPRPSPPRGGGGPRPSIIGLDKLNPADLQEILHHLVNLGAPDSQEHQRPHGHGHGHGPPPPPQHHPSQQPGTYTSVQTPQQVVELEREAGGRFVGRAEDGSYIVAIPQPPQQSPPNLRDPANVYSQVGRGPGPTRPRPGGPPQHQRPGPGAHALSPNAPPSAHDGFSGHFPPPPPPFGLPPLHPSHQVNDATKVSNIIVQPLNETTLQIDFTVSPIIVGLHGHVEVLYTKDFSRKPNPAQWESKVFQQAEDLIDNTHLQLFLMNLEPDTDYHLQIRVVVMAQLQPTSDILLVHTPAPTIPQTTLPPEISVDPEIQLASSGSRSVKLHWRRFDEFLNLIDGIQIAYKGSDDKVYATTPLIHRSVTEYELTNLKPNKDYEVNLLFIPFHTNQKTLLKSEKPIFIKTDKEEDEYAFEVALSPGKVSQVSIELKVAGVPQPEDKFVNLYQVFYSSDSEKEQKTYFKVPNAETSKRATLTDLRPGTKYTIWLEALMTNGKKKRSNVIDVMTKAGELPSPEKSEQDTLESRPELPQTSSYYGALVALAVVAAMSILGIIALLMILIKKQNQAKAPINDRKSESSYDNPSFKSYDIESNGHIKPGEL